MPEPEEPLMEVYLQPGEMYLAREPAILRTLLGSCVSVTFWSERLGIGALCHAMLPKCPQTALHLVPPQVGYRYVDYSIWSLARRFDEFGALRSELQIKLFGGADVLLSPEQVLTNKTVGSVNCDSAYEVLRCEGLQVAAASLRGTTGVNIRFNTATGEVQLRRMKHSTGSQDEHQRSKRMCDGC